MLIQLPNAFGNAATNMAIDSALLSALPQGIALFRHYGWSEPAITFGYTQHFQAVQRTAPPGLALCRRTTGGGIVDHRNDWTYALIIQNALPAAKLPATEFYEKLHRCIQKNLAQLSIESRLASCPRKCGTTSATKAPAADQCFITPAANDVLQPSGKKIAGAAMKRSREGLLVQGSIDRACLPDAFDFNTFASKFVEALSKTFAIPVGHSDDLRALFDGTKIGEERTRFSSTEWNQKR